MFHQKCPQNCLLLLLAVYLVKTGADTQGVGGGTPVIRQINIKNTMNRVK